MSLAPILLFTYNRLSHTNQTLEALLNNKLSKESELYIFSDGYKNDNDKSDVLKVRKLIHSIDGFKKIHIIENPHNYGLAKNIIQGVTKLIDIYGKIHFNKIFVNSSNDFLFELPANFKGLFFVDIQTSKGVAIKKILIQ